MLCEYNCGNEAKYFLKRAKKWCCSKSYNSCPKSRERNRKSHLGKKNHRFGKHCTTETKNFISEANKGNEPWNKGKTGVYTKKTLKLMSDRGKGFIPWNKNKNGYSLHSEETKQLLREISTGRKHTKETKIKIGNIHRGKIVSEESKKLMSKNHWDCSTYKNPNWKGGLSYQDYCRLWGDPEFKEYIKERDGYICLNPCCYKTSKILTIHHID